MPSSQREKLGNNAKNYFRKNFEHKRLIGQLIQHLETVISEGK